VGPRIVALTADATSETRMRCEAAGFSAFLTKPIDIPRLMSLLSPVSVETVRGTGTEDAGPESGTPPVAPDPRHPPGEDEPPVDTGVFRDLEEVGLTKEAVGNLIRTFLDSSQATMLDLAASVRDGDAERFHFLTHTLKGSAGQFGAMPLMWLSDACSRITPEEFRREGNVRLAALLREHGRAREVLSALIRP
jgi:CheY-like chemotaxis protein